MSDPQQNLVLYASFIQNRQQERTNKSFRLIKDLITNKGDPEALTKNLELSQTELKEKQLTSLKQAWQETTYPALTISDFVRYHTMYQTELLDLENIRLLANNNYLLQKKQEAGPQRAHEVTAESLGLTNSRRPIPKLPPTHITKETGANYGIDPSTGSLREQPLLYPTPITNLKEVNDILIYLPSTTLVDLQPSVKNIITRGRLLGFGERHYDACFKTFVNKFFPQYAAIFMNGVTASETFENILTIARSHDIVTVLKTTLRHFSRENNQSFTEFGTLLKELATRVVIETHLQMSPEESKEFAEDKLLTFITTFTSESVRKLFETERSTALRSNTEFYKLDGAILSIYKIELFVKPAAVRYTVSSDLFLALTNDTSLTSNVMLQAMSILNIKDQDTQSVTSPPLDFNTQMNATGFQSYDRNRSSYQSKSTQGPYRTPSQHRSNPRYQSPSPKERSNSTERDRKSQDRQGRDQSHRSRDRDQNGRQGSRDRDQGVRQRSRDRNQGGGHGRSPSRIPYPSTPRNNSGHDGRQHSSSNSRSGQYGRPQSRQTTPDRQQFRRDRTPSAGRNDSRDSRARSRSFNAGMPRGTSRDKNNQQARESYNDRQGHTPQRRESRDRPRSMSQGRERSRDRRDTSAYAGRSPSRETPRFCPYCGGPNCLMAECSVFEKWELSHWPCDHCSTKLLHRTSAHGKLK